MSPTVRIAIADDHYIVRRGVCSLLETEKNLEVVGEARDGMELLQSIPRWKPHIVILDLMMPTLNGLDTLPQLVEAHPAIQIIVFSMYANEPYVVQALQAGASGYVLKEAPPNDLRQAVQAVLNGRRFLSAPLSERSVESYLADKVEKSASYKKLTVREKEILRLVVEGLTSNEIGQQLFISPRTVEVHRANLVRKLGVRSKMELVHYAIRLGVLPPN